MDHGPNFRLNWMTLSTASHDLCRALLALYAETMMLGPSRTRMPPETYDGIRALRVLMPKYFLDENAETPEGVIPLSLLQVLSEFVCQSYVRWSSISPDEGRHLHLDRIICETEDKILPCTTDDLLFWCYESDRDFESHGSENLQGNERFEVLYDLPRVLAPQLVGKRALQPLVVTHRGEEYLVVGLGGPAVGALITQENVDTTDEITLLPLHFVDITK